MTTHDQPTVNDSPSEPTVSVSETTQMEDEGTAVTSEPARADRTAATSAEPQAAEPPSAHHESSADEVLFDGDNLAELRARWAGVQSAFVDDPKDCVQKADALVSDLVEQLTSGFAETRAHLEDQWHRGEEASTEDLRMALMHYREFFERLLAV